MKKRLARLLARLGSVVRRAVAWVRRPRASAELRLTAQAAPLLEEPVPVPTWTYQSPRPAVTDAEFEEICEEVEAAAIAAREARRQAAAQEAAELERAQQASDAAGRSLAVAAAASDATALTAARQAALAEALELAAARDAAAQEATALATARQAALHERTAIEAAAAAAAQAWERDVAAAVVACAQEAQAQQARRERMRQSHVVEATELEGAAEVARGAARQMAGRLEARATLWATTSAEANAAARADAARAAHRARVDGARAAERHEAERAEALSAEGIRRWVALAEAREVAEGLGREAAADAERGLAEALRRQGCEVVARQEAKEALAAAAAADGASVALAHALAEVARIVAEAREAGARLSADLDSAWHRGAEAEERRGAVAVARGAVAALTTDLTSRDVADLEAAEAVALEASGLSPDEAEVDAWGVGDGGPDDDEAEQGEGAQGEDAALQAESPRPAGEGSTFFILHSSPWDPSSAANVWDLSQEAPQADPEAAQSSGEPDDGDPSEGATTLHAEALEAGTQDASVGAEEAVALQADPEAEVTTEAGEGADAEEADGAADADLGEDEGLQLDPSIVVDFVWQPSTSGVEYAPAVYPTSEPVLPESATPSQAEGAPALEGEVVAPAAPSPRETPRPEITIPKDYVPSAESAHELYQLDLEMFSGPLDLLLHLIRRHHLDICDIPMSFICERYLEYLQLMEDLNIDVAAEFLYMAAELAHIKSRMLLPKDAEEEEEEEGDPRADLVRRLLEYQKFRAAADGLGQLQHYNRDVFGRPPEKIPAPAGEAPLKEVSIFALVHAFNEVLKRQKPEVRHRVVMEEVSMRKRMLVIIDALVAAESVPFYDLLEGLTHRLDIVMTFLAILEMTRLKLLRLYESEEGNLYLNPRFETGEVALARIAGVDEQQYAG